MRRLLLTTALVAIASWLAGAQTRTGAVLFEGARLVTGERRAPIDDSAFLVDAGRITAVGARGTIKAPAGATVVDLRGKTVIPTLIDAHSHLGYTDVRTGITAAASYTRDNLLDHLRRYAYYGIAATASLGLDRGELPYELRATPTPGAALFLTAGRGIAMPNAGPNAAYWRDAAYGVTTETEGRAAVRELAAKKVDIVKIWVDDRNKTVTPLPPSLYRPIIDDAHMRGLRVVAHVYYLADAKELLRAGIDGFAHGIRDLEVDEEIMTLFKQRPQVVRDPESAGHAAIAGGSRVAQRDPAAVGDRRLEADGRGVAAAAATVRGSGTKSREALGRGRAHRVRNRCRGRRALRLVGTRRDRRHGRGRA